MQLSTKAKLINDFKQLAAAYFSKLLYDPEVPEKVGTLNLIYFLHVLIRQLQQRSILLYALAL
jgi:hypothetical protein